MSHTVRSYVFTNIKMGYIRPSTSCNGSACTVRNPTTGVLIIP